MANMTVVDSSVLDCAICYLPLKPPGHLPCDVGHVLCSTCGDKHKGAGKCYLCGVALAGGYRRCHAMESVVEFVRGPCPNAAHGCAATPAYHYHKEHLLACLHAPCHCPGEACAFAGHTVAMLDHIASTHRWPSRHVRVWRSHHRRSLDACPHADFSVRLSTGFHFVMLTDLDYEEDNKYLFLLNVTRHPFCRVSVIWIRARGEAVDVKEIRFVLSYSKSWSDDKLIEHDQKTEFTVPSSDLSEGLPDSNGCHQLIVPSTCDDGDHMKVNIEISVDRTRDQLRLDMENAWRWCSDTEDPDTEDYTVDYPEDPDTEDYFTR